VLQFVVDPKNPLEGLEDCAVQLDMLTDLLCQGERGGVDLGEMASAGLADLLRAMSKAVSASVDIIRRVYPAGLEIIEREPAPADEAAPGNRSERLALIARLLAEDADASDTLAGRASAAGGADTLPAAPRLTEPRAPTRSGRSRLN